MDIKPASMMDALQGLRRMAAETNGTVSLSAESLSEIENRLVLLERAVADAKHITNIYEQQRWQQLHDRALEVALWNCPPAG